ncbi:NLP-like protein [Plasmopara halstedii]|uniref:NLP-like protein n=1 Tax=Plasmopara halstedii TaxID=4781 RepID=A0A0P1ANP0_PLAHL|nr:NLP-like protein [Plasmopara halstedii]CEG43052.1 NLP-like protein [Plasmopara halstedii]|eukprot:XP_024579421.1 NLP-like protein [Plasmopara halstedii]
MHLWTLAGSLLAALVACSAGKIDHDKIKPIEERQPVTLTERLVFKFNPSMKIREELCVDYPAVDADGNFSGGLKPTNGNSGCERPPMDSQVYVRVRKYEEMWAIVYVWYFPKRFQSGWPSARHDWEQAVVWFDDLKENPYVVSVATSRGGKYLFFNPSHETTYGPPLHFFPNYFGAPTLIRESYPVKWKFYKEHPRYYIVMWEQLPEPARAALSDDKNFGDAKCPIRDDKIDHHLEKAYLTDAERKQGKPSK